MPARQALIVILSAIAFVTLLLVALMGTAVTLLAQIDPTEQTQTAEREEMLALAGRFSGGNDDWEPFATIFPDDPVGAEMMLVPTGEFMMGSEGEYDDEQPVHLQQFPAPFWIDRTEVTMEQFQGCVDAGVCTASSPGDDPSQADRPVNDVNWFEANTFCQWRGARLPTEAEWEYAARGPDGWQFPWGDEWDETNVVYDGNSEGETAVVGSRPGGASWVGALDMSGNVEEWVSSLYEDYPYNAYDGREAETGDSLRVLRGGSFFYSDLDSFRAAYRFFFPPEVGSGFRCARSSEALMQAMIATAEAVNQAGTATAVAEATTAATTVIAFQTAHPETANALAIASDFSGGNEDWQPVAHVFSDDPAGTEMMLVPVGTFMMGSEDGDDDEQPVHMQAFTEPFWIDRTEITRGQYQGCVDVGVCSEKSANAASSDIDQPIIFVTWFEARDYCVWRGARLPTEAEWEFAARGPDSWVYPWGDALDEANTVYDGNSGSETAMVGSRPQGVSWVGASDMSGNVWEWLSSLDEPYPYHASDGREDDTGDRTDILRELRGGSFHYGTDYLRAANRGGDFPDGAFNDVGFRCARSLF